MARGAFLVALLALGSAGGASAAGVTYSFSGVLHPEFGVRDDRGVLGGVFVEGVTPFTGTLRYDPATPASSAGIGITRYGHAPLGSLGMVVNIEGHTFTVDPNGDLPLEPGFPLLASVSESSRLGQDRLSFQSRPFDNPFDFNVFNVAFVDSTMTVFDGTALPASIDLTDYDFAWFLLQGFGGLQLQGEIETLVLVPEPSTGLLLGLGVTAIGLRGRERGIFRGR